MKTRPKNLNRLGRNKDEEGIKENPRVSTDPAKILLVKYGVGLKICSCGRVPEICILNIIHSSWTKGAVNRFPKGLAFF